ncbi:uncharacterized protein LAESUDRAFT_562466 [Laetiporus sulphureus 93-53]|uniref:Uncharacterized protein n=1 Tax=Laetiporus sulphureus 93-53 TaxID=1314785 RepID=A0A165B4P4_9APHY|nr:uncharacterized protein LAESUDRAFT_562466 [Laetiporus sulphureus 93-53]KZT00228.1 hypothetical protein LAESUDRAFT_562466 [Laetiporus sulphureus 93-53]
MYGQLLTTLARSQEDHRKSQLASMRPPNSQDGPSPCPRLTPRRTCSTHHTNRREPFPASTRPFALGRVPHSSLPLQRRQLQHSCPGLLRCSAFQPHGQCIRDMSVAQPILWYVEVWRLVGISSLRLLLTRMLMRMRQL